MLQVWRRLRTHRGRAMVDLDFRMFDADNHYYEDMDAFSRPIEPEFRKRTMQSAEIDGKQRLLVGGKVSRFIRCLKHHHSSQAPLTRLLRPVGSTAGWTRTGASPTRSASTPPPTPARPLHRANG